MCDRGSGLIIGTWTQNSDMRLKNRLYDVTNVLPRLAGIDVFAFTMKSGYGARRLGVSAQQVQMVFPELIGCDTATEEKYLSVDYSSLGAVVAIQGCKELYAEIGTLKGRIKELEETIKKWRHEKVCKVAGKDLQGGDHSRENS